MNMKITLTSKRIQMKTEYKLFVNKLMLGSVKLK